jgi:cell division protein FtsL
LSEENNIPKNEPSTEEPTPAVATVPKKGFEASFENSLGVLLFLGILCIPYIYISHLTHKKYRQSEKIKSELKELRAEYITLKSEIVGQNKQSDISKKLRELNIQELSEAPIDLNDPTTER